MHHEIDCVTLSGGKIDTFGTIQDLMGSAGDEIFLIDMDAIKRGKPSFKFYQEISKYFDVHVLSLVTRMDDLVDSIILGCQSVVVSPNISASTIADFLEVSDNIVMPYSSLPSSREFSKLGGSYFLSNVIINYSFNLTYYYGLGDPGDNYVRLKGFPLQSLGLPLE